MDSSAAGADQPYESPAITDLGSFTELTLGTSSALPMDNGMASQA